MGPMDTTTVVLWIFGSLITIIVLVIGAFFGIIVALWRDVTGLQVELAKSTVTPEEVRVMIRDQLVPIMDKQTAMFNQLARLEDKMDELVDRASRLISGGPRAG